MSRRMLGGLVVLVMLCAGPGPVEGKKGIQVMQVVKVSLDYKAEWDMDGGDTTSKGHLKITFKGRMSLNEGFSSTSYGLPAMLLPYAIEGLQATYEYEEKVTQHDPPDGCPSLLEEYQASGDAVLPQVAGPGSLLIYNAGAVFKDKAVWKHIPAAEKKLMVDRYDLILPGKEIQAEGRKRPRSSCKFKKAEHDVELGPVKVEFLMDKGELKGKRSWSAEGGSVRPVFQVGVSNLPAEFDREPYTPKKEDGGEVDYSVEWSITEAAVVDIERKVKGKWHVLTDSLRDVTVGERIELRGVVLPKKKDPKKGLWTVGDGKEPAAIKEFKGSNKSGGPVYLDDDDLGGQIVKFSWFKGGKQRVVYEVTVGEEQLSKEVVFKVRKPGYDVSWEASKTSRMVDDIGPSTLPLFKKWSKSNWPPGKPQYGKEGLSGKLSGLQYDGILFTAVNKSEDEMPGKTQWVQLIRETQVYWEGGAKTEPCTTDTGLDHVYPCAVNDSFFDAPAMPTRNISVDNSGWKVEMVLRLYVMYKPSGKGSQWVPVRRIDWKWSGTIVRPVDGGDWSYDSGLGPGDPGNAPVEVKDPEYPEWTKNSADLTCK